MSQFYRNLCLKFQNIPQLTSHIYLQCLVNKVNYLNPICICILIGEHPQNVLNYYTLNANHAADIAAHILFWAMHVEEWVLRYWASHYSQSYFSNMESLAT